MKFFILSIGLIWSAIALADIPHESSLLKVNVLSCYDGDTCTFGVDSSNETPVLWFKGRLFGIDCQEKTSEESQKLQPMALPATERINELIHGKKAWVRQSDTDRFGRLVVEIFHETPEGLININRLLVEEGFCEVYRGKTKKFSKKSYFEMESQAKDHKLGIWRLDPYLKPGDYRFTYLYPEMDKKRYGIDDHTLSKLSEYCEEEDCKFDKGIGKILIDYYD
jgi:endonuclease YncB( thermonuclease family)